MFRDYITQLDMRFARNFRFGTLSPPGDGGRLQHPEPRHGHGAEHDVRRESGHPWLNPTSIQTWRYVRFGGQFSF